MPALRSLHVLLVALVLIVLMMPNAYCDDKGEKYKPDQKLVQAAKKKAEELGYNPIPMFVESEGGNIMITGGAMLSIRNGRQTYVEKDMIINVGEFPIPVQGFKINKGEYAVVLGGKFVKQDGKIEP